jgi:hypothetical protein
MKHSLAELSIDQLNSLLADEELVLTAERRAHPDHVSQTAQHAHAFIQLIEAEKRSRAGSGGILPSDRTRR